jgi:ubiquinone/menaquinone biosynthesis C-methylase UbiE
MNRVVMQELLDTDSCRPDEVEESLADLRFINKAFGGVSTTTKLLRKVVSKTGLRQISFLDVAGASGDVAAGAAKELAKSGLALSPTIMDRAFDHLAASNQGVAVAGDALQLPFKDGSFDVVGCALFAHHLEPNQIVKFVNEALRVCRHACIINDLRRSRLHLLSVLAGRALYRSPITSHDSAASVKRAYTRRELEHTLRLTSAASIDISSHYLFRMGAIAWKKRAQ